jgi:hypothetical protein
MSRQVVRDQIVEYLRNADITGLSTIYAFPPKITPEGAFYPGQAPNQFQGAIVFTFIESQSEQRVAYGGAHNGRKFVTYNFVFSSYYRSTQGQAEVAAMGNETFLDSFVSAIRANRKAGAPPDTQNNVWQWGEAGVGGKGPDIQIQSDLPVMLGGAQEVTQTFSTIRVTVLEEVDT